MPLYDWKDRKSEKVITVLRHFSAYEEKPTVAEAQEGNMTPEEYEAADWERLIGADIRVTRGLNWNGGKGYW